MYSMLATILDWYVDTCDKQGSGDEAKQIADILKTRFAK